MEILEKNISIEPLVLKEKRNFSRIELAGLICEYLFRKAHPETDRYAYINEKVLITSKEELHEKFTEFTTSSISEIDSILDELKRSVIGIRRNDENVTLGYFLT